MRGLRRAEWVGALGAEVWGMSKVGWRLTQGKYEIREVNE